MAVDTMNQTFDTICISETVNIERWSGKNERSWHLLEEGKPIAKLTFSENKGMIRVSSLNVEGENLCDIRARELILRLQARYPAHWLEVPTSIGNELEYTTVGKRVNEDRKLAEIILQKFDARMNEAAVAYDHMNKYKWGFRGRMEFYGKYPEFLDREEVREKLASKVSALPEHLVRVEYPSESIAGSR